MRRKFPFKCRIKTDLNIDYSDYVMTFIKSVEQKIGDIINK